MAAGAPDDRSRAWDHGSVNFPASGVSGAAPLGASGGAPLGASGGAPLGASGAEIGGISMSNHDHANWVNHLQPLYIAGQIFAENTTFPLGHKDPLADQQPLRRSAGRGPTATEAGSLKYAEEKFTLLKHLQVIQCETGWKTDERARELRHLWGLQ